MMEVAGGTLIDKETARSIALAEVNRSNAYCAHPIERVIEDRYTLEKEYGWVFFYQSRKYVETQDSRHALCGNGPILVLREDGQIVQFGTGRPTEWYLTGYEAGFRSGSGKLTITHVSDMETTLGCLDDLRLTYVIPEFAYGVEWRIPKIFQPQEIERMLHNLPAVFEEIGIALNYETFLKMDASRCCDYTLERDDWRHHSPAM